MTFASTVILIRCWRYRSEAFGGYNAVGSGAGWVAGLITETSNYLRPSQLVVSRMLAWHGGNSK